MYWLLGLLAAALAGSAADAFMKNALDEPESSEDPDADDSAPLAEGGGSIDLLAYAAPEEVDAPAYMAEPSASLSPELPWDHDPMDSHPFANGQPAHESPDASWHDPALDDGVHSSDSFPPPEDRTTPQLLRAHDGGQTLQGGPGDDTLLGGAGNDTLNGGPGNDILVAVAGNNALNGGPGDDILIGGPGDDTLVGGWGDDLLIAGGGSNVLMGGAGDDVLIGGIDGHGGQNFLNGGAGDDTLFGGGDDVLHGGPGADRFVLGDWIGPGERVTIMDYTPGEDRIQLLINPDIHPDPELLVSPDPDDPNNAVIRLDGEDIGLVLNAAGLRVEDIDLIAEGSEDGVAQGA
ncbi:calcium-binding protein [Rhabdonatronobacter sediminivivens]|nr:calcium-binding protein [Rhabdonatronobacter sediminivivens]